MRFSTLLVTLLAAGGRAASWVSLENSVAAPLPSHAEWEDRGAAPPLTPVHVVLAVRQNEGAESECEAVSTPGAPRYGQYLDRDELAARLARPESAAAVRGWLLAAGVDAGRVDSSRAHDFVRARLTAAEAAELFRADVRVKEHAPTGVVLPHAASYLVPAEMAEHLDIVAGLTRLPNMRRRAGIASVPAAPQAGGGDNPTVTPQFLRSFYEFPADLTDGSANATAAVAEFPYGGLGPQGAAESFVQSWFDSYLQMYGLPPATVTTAGVSANDPSACSTAGGDRCVESSLDIQVLAGASGLKETGFWVTRTNSTPEHFLDWMASVADADEPEHVFSCSFGDPEDTFTDEYRQRSDRELAKLCARGITFLSASGDCGITDNCDRAACEKPNVDWPPSSPYTLAVGATQVLDGGVEVVSSTTTGSRITSGGGFSEKYARPAFQGQAIDAYLGSGVKLPTAFPFNRTGAGVPDVSMVGHNYEIVAGNGKQGVDGTSASTPAMAAVVAIVNAARSRVGLPRVGFVTPALYTPAVAATFYDVTSGSNACAEEFCCDQGYLAHAGWDPATGLGTPRVGALIKALSSL